MDKATLFSQADSIIEKYDRDKERLIQMLLDLQNSSEHNYLPAEFLERLSEKLDMPLSKVSEVATFYSMFNHEPKGKYIIEICKSAPCHVRGSTNVALIFEELLGIKIGETTPDGLFSIQHSSCFGACDISPAIKVGEKVYGNLTREKIEEMIKILRYIGGNEHGENNKIDI